MDGAPNALLKLTHTPEKCSCNDKRTDVLPRFPIWDDVRTFDGKPWHGRIDVVSGGFPCTDISRANANAEGLERQQKRTVV